MQAHLPQCVGLPAPVVAKVATSPAGTQGGGEVLTSSEQVIMVWRIRLELLTSQNRRRRQLPAAPLALLLLKVCCSCSMVRQLHRRLVRPCLLICRLCLTAGAHRRGTGHAALAQLRRGKWSRGSACLRDQHKALRAR